MAREPGSGKPAAFMPDDSRLDDHASSALSTGHAQPCNPPATMPTGAVLAGRRSNTADPARLVEPGLDLANQRTGLGRAAASVADPSRSDREFIVVHARPGDGAGNGQIAPISGQDASRGTERLALKAQQFQ